MRELRLHEQAGRRRLAVGPGTPTVDACARCALPNASLTYRSPSARERVGERRRRWPLRPGGSAGSRGEAPAPRRVRRPALLRGLADAVVRERPPDRPRSDAQVSRRPARARIQGRGLPLGRPRCEAKNHARPASRAASWIVGSDAAMRASSVTRPASIGTLKSTRQKTRFRARSRRSRTLELAGHGSLLDRRQRDACRRDAASRGRARGSPRARASNSAGRARNATLFRRMRSRFRMVRTTPAMRPRVNGSSRR